MNTASEPRPIVILISGRGSNMRALIAASRTPDSAYRVAGVLSDQPDAGGLLSARELGIPAQAIPCPKTVARDVYGKTLVAAIDQHAPVLVALAGFMRILSPGFVAHYAGRLLNIHPSLLPRYAGLHTHRRALEAHDAEHGATVHFVTDELDGGPRVIQARVPIHAQDTEESLSQRVIVAEHRIYPLAVNWFCEGRLHCDRDQAWLDGEALNEPVRSS